MKIEFANGTYIAYVSIGPDPNAGGEAAAQARAKSRLAEEKALRSHPMTAGNRAVKAASPLRKRLRIYTATKNGGIARFGTVTATARP